MTEPGKENSSDGAAAGAAPACAPPAGSIKAMFEHGARAIETQRCGLAAR
jgi:hypothetical protein